jgi:hypothetical protein
MIVLCLCNYIIDAIAFYAASNCIGSNILKELKWQHLVDLIMIFSYNKLLFISGQPTYCATEPRSQEDPLTKELKPFTNSAVSDAAIRECRGMKHTGLRKGFTVKHRVISI